MGRSLIRAPPSMFPVSRPDDARPRARQGLHQLAHARVDGHPSPIPDLRLEQRLVAPVDVRLSGGDRRLVHAGPSEEITDDLRVGTAAEVVAVDRARGAVHVPHGLVEGPAPRSARAEQGAVDVEQDELHDAGPLHAHAGGRRRPKALDDRGKLRDD